MNPVRAICFYLPQYHPIPENDRWWGAGFTDWRNVAKSRPRFRGHHQPRLPADLGFYDLRLEETRVAQAELARRYGIGGFCYYHYWFNGRLLLETPLQAMLASGRPDFPFCLCWANENWSRRWDGRERDLLMAQDYAGYDPEAHMAWLARALADPRYIRVHGKPLFLVYNASDIPALAQTLTRWRQAASGLGLPGLYLCAVMSWQNRMTPAEAIAEGFDATVEFHPHPHRGGPAPLWPQLRYLGSSACNRALTATSLCRQAPFATARVYSYRAIAEAAMASSGATFPCVIPQWDNSARKRHNAVVIQNDDPQLYGRWLRHAAARVAGNSPDERLVFINAWNEWAEGCYLEPDVRNGHRFLAATRDALGAAAARPAAVPVGADDWVDVLLATYNGERFVAEQIESVLAQTHRNLRLLIRDDGSTDGTPAILERYRSEHHDRVHLLTKCGGPGGPAANFATLLACARSPYVMPCDQDDVWLPRKVELSLARMKALEAQCGAATPLLVHTDLTVVDAQLRLLCPSFWRWKRLDPRARELSRLVVRNNVTGCTTLVNRALLDLCLPVPPQALMHDWWMALVAAGLGRIDYLDEPTVLYRQHGGNAVAGSGYDLRYALAKALGTREWRERRREGFLRMQAQAAAVLQTLGGRLGAEHRVLLRAYAGLGTQGFLARRAEVFRHGFYDMGLLRNLGMLACL